MRYRVLSLYFNNPHSMKDFETITRDVLMQGIVPEGNYMTLSDNFTQLSKELLEMIVLHGSEEDAARAKAVLQAQNNDVQEYCYIPSPDQALQLTVSAHVMASSATDAAAILRNELRLHFRGQSYGLRLFPKEPRVKNLVLIFNPKDLKHMRRFSVGSQFISDYLE